MVPPLGVEPRPSAFQADAQTSYARVGHGVSGDTPRPQLWSCQRDELKLRVPDPGVEPGCHGSEPRVLPLDQSGSPGFRARAHVSRSSGGHRSQWGPRELNPAGLCGRRVYSAPRLPYRSRAPLMSPPKAAESRRATESSRWLLRASATRSTELREWSPPSGNDATELHGRLTVRPGREAAAIAAEARKPGPAGLVRQCFFVAEVHHDEVPGG
jgi:hypothetical protein